MSIKRLTNILFAPLGAIYPRTPHYLKCGCRRAISIKQSRPTQFRAGNTGQEEHLRRFLKQHKTTLPADFPTDVDLDWLPIIHPNHFNDYLHDLEKSTSPGYYFTQKGYKTKADVIQQIPNELRYYCHLIKTGKLRNPRPLSKFITVNSKFDESKQKLKSRVIFLYPLQVCAIENMWFSEIKKHFPENYIPTPETHHKDWCGKDSHSVDFTSFDSSVPRVLIERAMDILERHFDHSEYASGDIPYSKTSLWRLWKFVRWYFLNTPTLLGDKVYTKYHGLPSGSMFTNLLCTLISKLVLTYIHRKLDCNSKCITYGDDCHVKNCKCNSTDIVTCAENYFGMKARIEYPHEHGCLTYCKTECHEGKSFHPGIWYSNILNVCSKKLVGQVAECLKYMQPTRFQFKELCKICPEPEKLKFHEKFLLSMKKILTSGHTERADEMFEKGYRISLL